MADDIIFNLTENTTQIAAVEESTEVEVDTTPAVAVEVVENVTNISIVETVINIEISVPGVPGPSGDSERETRDVDSDYTVIETDSVLLVDASAGPVEITLIQAATHRKKVFDIVKVDQSTNAVIVIAASGEQIGVPGATQIENDVPGANVSLISNGVQWFVL